MEDAMTKEELRGKIADAVIEVCNSMAFFKALHDRGVAIASDGMTDGEEPPVDTIDVCIDVRGIERDDPRMMFALHATHEDGKPFPDLPTVGFRTLVDGKDDSERFDGVKLDPVRYPYVTQGL